MCPAHKAYFQGLREQLQVEASNRVRKRTGRGMTCCRQGCANSRLRGEAFCDDCQAAGYTEERE
jgi:hypothetical protein